MFNNLTKENNLNEYIEEDLLPEVAENLKYSQGVLGRLKKYKNTPLRESTLDQFKKSCFWDYSEKKSSYYHKDSTVGYDQAIKVIEQNINKPYSDVVNILKKDSRYKYSYFFKRSVDRVLKEVTTTNLCRWYYCDDYYLNKDFIITRRDSKVKIKHKRKDTGYDYTLSYKDGVIIKRYKGIHYFLIKEGYYKEIHGHYYSDYVADELKQLNSYWLKVFGLTNFNFD